MTDRPPRARQQPPRPAEPLSAAGILGSAFRLYAARAGYLWALVAVPVVPFGVALCALAAAAPDTAAARDGLALVQLAGNFLLVLPLANGAVVTALDRAATGARASVGSVYATVLPLLPALVGTAILAALAVTVGVVALVLPGIALLVLLQLYAQVVVIERRVLLGALRRSFRLVRGPAWRGAWRSWWRAAGVTVAVAIVSVVVTEVVAVLLSPLAGTSSGEHGRVADVAVAIPGQLLVTPYAAIALTLLFYDLRLRGERAEPGAAR